GVGNTAMRAMRTLPLPPADKQAILLLVVQLVRSYTQLERDLRAEGHPLDNPRVAELLASVVTPERFGDLVGRLEGGRYPDDPDNPDDEGEDANWAVDLMITGIHQLVREPPADDAATATPPAAELTPAQRLAVAEAELESVLTLRKQAQQRVKELERRVRDATRDRDRAKERAKAARA